MTATPHSVSLLMYHLTMFDQALRAALWSPWQQELSKNCKNWLRWWSNIFHVNKHSPAIPCLISLFFFSTPDLKLKTNEFVYDGMLCFPLNPSHWHVVLFTVLPTPPRFGFCMHNFWISPMEMWCGAHELSIKTQDRRLVASLQSWIHSRIFPLNWLGNNDHTWTMTHTMARFEFAMDWFATTTAIIMILIIMVLTIIM